MGADGVWPSTFFLFLGNMAQRTNGESTAEPVRSCIERVVTAEGYELVDVEQLTDRGQSILRVYLDSCPSPPEGPGVRVEDCSRVSRLLGDILDVEAPVSGPYRLEVSSPGIFRPLRQTVHFERAVGKRIRLKTYQKIANRRVFTGFLQKVEGGVLTLEVDGLPVDLELTSVAKANLEPDWK